MGESLVKSCLVMKNGKKLLVLVIQLIVLWWLSYALGQYKVLVAIYSKHVYALLQNVRHSVLGLLPVSVGDVLYLAAGVWLLLTVVKWVRYIFRWRENKTLLAGSVLSSLNVLLLVYMLFVVGWGAHYYKLPLAKVWGLEQPHYHNADKRKQELKNTLRSYTLLLAGKLNEYAPRYCRMDIAQINDSAVSYYQRYTNSSVKGYGLGIKPSLYGWLMQRMAVDGYFNPFTGEGQVTRQLPEFMLPFTLCHEMAHQVGIAAEGDANLLAYAVSTTTDNATFRYSAYLNLWLYASRRLYYIDSSVAKAIAATLPPLTSAHIDTLEQLSRRYHGLLTSYSGTIYDNYLRAQNQQDGIRSYGNVTYEAMLLEEHRQKGFVESWIKVE